jgi:small subunit ribosomal protein S16
MGTRGKPFYRMVVADSRCARDGRFIDLLGHYDPRTEPVTLKIDEEKALMWLSRGAQPSDTAAALLKKQNIMEKFLATKAGKATATTAEAQEEPKTPARKRRTTKPAVEEPEAVQAEPQVAAVPEAVVAEAEANQPAEVQPTEEQSSEEQG